MMPRFHLPSALLAASLAAVVSGAARAQIAVVSETVDEHVAAPGQTYQGRILVRNTGKEPAEARIYQTDYNF